MTKRVPLAEAKNILDQLLQHTTKISLAQRSGLSMATLVRIDNCEHLTVERGTVEALKKIAV